ncbi:MAG: hypothetical protein QOJ54_1303 [Aliidongia sp.]|jgi:tetratricopeptide (TPR) repeat protein|nr:hypothetical protein [Aliidongia sp.]
MASRPEDAATAIDRRYGTTAAAEWELVLRHIDFATGFSLIVLIVPDRDGAELCARELEQHLAAKGKPMRRLQPVDPEELRRIALPLLDSPAGPDIGAAWVSAVVSHTAPDYEDWVAAWRYALATLNQQRNPLRRHFACPVIFVGARWLVPVFREIAPDLWSVRTQVVQIEPGPLVDATPPDPDRRRVFDRAPENSPDLELALDGIARLRGVSGQEDNLALLLERAGMALFIRGDFPAAEEKLREATNLRLQGHDPVRTGNTVYNLAVAVRAQTRAVEAEAAFRQALALKEKGRATAVERGAALHGVALAVHDQGRAAEAEGLFRQALSLMEEGGGTAVERGVTLHELARAVLDQGHAAEAEALLRRALALIEEGGGSAIWRGITSHELARAVFGQGRWVEAEALFRQALGWAEEGGDTAAARGTALHELARAVLTQGRAAEAEALFRQALALAEDGDDTVESRQATLYELARAVLDQGRLAEAQALIRQAAALEEGDDRAGSDPL